MPANVGADSRQSNVRSLEELLRTLSKSASEPYYLLHFLLFFSYFPFRLAAANVLSPLRSSIILRREIQALVAFTVLVSVKSIREETWENFIQNTLFYAKIFLAALALVMDYHLALWYTIVYLVIYVSTQQPSHEGLGTLNQLTPLLLESLLTEGSTSRFWLVEFRALSTSSCVGTSSFFPELSITYSNQILSFGAIDLGLFPNAAEKFGIPLVSLNQLPTYIQYENGTEVSRYPEVEFEAKIFSAPLTKKLLCKHFELDKILLDYINGK